MFSLPFPLPLCGFAPYFCCNLSYPSAQLAFFAVLARLSYSSDKAPAEKVSMATGRIQIAVLLESRVYLPQESASRHVYVPKGRLPAVLTSSSASSAAARHRSRGASVSVLFVLSTCPPDPGRATKRDRTTLAADRGLTALVPVPEQPQNHALGQTPLGRCDSSIERLDGRVQSRGAQPRSGSDRIVGREGV